MAKRKKVGRRKGGKKRGYFFRSGRGWYALDSQKRACPLRDERGEHIRDKDADERLINEAYARWLLAQEAEALPKKKPATFTVQDICAAYLRYCQSRDRERTFVSRADALYDFCTGFPAKFRKADPTGTKTPRKHRIHDGYGHLDVTELIPFHVDQWIAAHPKWDGGKRTKIQAVKRALNYAVESKLISASPIKGYKVDKPNIRKTYISPELEQAMYEHGKPAIATAIRVCIRTGARYGSEFAILTARHITDYGDRMEWRFSPKESKTKKERVIRVTDPEIIEITRRQIERYPIGPVFRNTRGAPWTQSALKEAFDRLRGRLKRKGVAVGDDIVMYSCRHTYAKRTLQGYWTGTPTNIETLCGLMGNTREVCWEHYADWCDQYTDPLWKAC